MNRRDVGAALPGEKRDNVVAAGPNFYLEGGERESELNQLEQSETRFHMLVDSVKDYALFMLDPDGNISSWNSGAERILGYKAKEVLGKYFSIFYTPEGRDQGHPERELEIARTQGRYEEEGWRIRKDGMRFLANVVLTPMIGSDGSLQGFAKVVRDITQGQELIETEERFRLLVSAVKDYAIFMLDPSGNISSWNAGAQRIIGYTEDEILGKHFSIFYTPEDLSDGKPDRELRIAVADGKYEEEVWRVRKDGTRFWSSVLISAVWDKSGNLRGFAKVTRDMTQRREMEERLRELNRQLESFAYSVSHDLRAPLRNVAFTSKMLLEDYQDNLDAEGKNLLETQVASTTKLASVIDALLELSRLSRMKVKREPVNLSELALGLVDDLQSAGSEGIMPNVQVQPGMEARADPTLLRMILLNLLDNAIKFSPNGGTFTIGELRQDEKQVFFVRDEGTGFNMEFAEKIFLPFERLVTDEEVEGSGIGLANVQQAVLRHGGRVWVESKPGDGTTFYFTLS